MKITAQMSVSGELQLTLYGYVDGYDISARAVAALLEQHPQAHTITVHLDSPGGNVFEGNAIRARLEAHQARKIINIDGLAASIASVIALAGDEVNIAEGGMMMIHEASTFGGGGVDDLEAARNMLIAINASMASLYSKRTGKPLAEIVAAMKATTWFSAEQAVAYGLATRVVEAKKAAAQWDLSQYANAPKLTRQENKDNRDNMLISAELRTRFGLAENATAEDLVAAIDAQNAARAVSTPKVVPQVAAPLTAEAVARIVTETIAVREAAALVSAAPSAAAAHELAVVSAVERFIATGKIIPAAREQAIKVCGSTGASLSACVAYWESAPPIGEPVRMPALTPAAALTGKGTKGGKLLAKMVADAGVSQASVDAVLAEMN